MTLVPDRIWQAATFIDRWHWVLLASAAPFLLFPSPSRSLALLVVPGLWLLTWAIRRRPLPHTPLNLSLLLLAVMVGVSLFATYDLTVSLPKLAGIVLGLGIFFAVAREARQPEGWWLCFGLYALLTFGMAVLAIIGAQWGTKITVLAPVLALLPPRLIDLGVKGGFSPNELAGALVWAIPVLLALSALAVVRRQALQFGLGNAMMVAAFAFLGTTTLGITGVLVLSQSRGGYLGLAAGMAALVLPVLWHGARRVVLGLTVALCTVIIVILVLHTDTPSPFSNTFPGLTSTNAVETWEARVEVWSRGIYAIQDFPLTGMGMNTFRYVAPIFYPFFLLNPDIDIAHAHNEFLQAGLDLGIPGLVAFVALYIGAFALLFQVWKTGVRTGVYTSPELGALMRVLALGFGAGLIAHVVYGLTDVVALGSKPGFLWWMYLGLIVTLFEQARSGELVEWTRLPAAIRRQLRRPAIRKAAGTR